MSNIPKTELSPFFKAKTQLSLLRFCLGFPLKVKNEKFPSFEFRNVLELIRYLMYLALVGGSIAVFLGVIYTSNRTTNRILNTFNDSLKKYGFSGLDIAVVLLLPFFNIISNTIHLILFKYGAKRLNKLNASLSLINQDLQKLLGNDLFDSFEEQNKPKGLKRYLFLLYVTVIPNIASAMISISFSAIIFQNESLELSIDKKVTFTTLFSVFTVCYMYPPTSASADSVVYILLKEAKEICEKFNVGIVLRQNHDSDSGMNRTIYKTIPRYILPLQRKNQLTFK